jgi:N-methylhydantoinase A
VFGSLEEQAISSLKRAGFADEVHVLARSADLRYLGQAFEVRASAPSGDIDGDFVATVVDRFHDQHERLYGYCYRDDPSHAVEWVNVRVAGIGPIDRPQPRELEGGDGDARRARTGHRRVHFANNWTHAGIYRRDRLLAGDVIEGPAVIEEFGSTLPIPPGFTGRVDAYGDVVVQRSGA